MLSQTDAQFTTRLTDEQLESLRSCARGISLRFEKPEIVNALLEGGYAEKNVAGVITVTAKGLKYLQTKFTSKAYTSLTRYANAD